MMVVQRSMIAVRCAKKLVLMAHLSTRHNREEKEGMLMSTEIGRASCRERV